MIFGHEGLVVGAEDGDAIDQRQDSGNTGPEEQQIQNACTYLAQIELMDTDIAQKQRQNTGNNLTLNRPIGSFGVYITLRRIVALRGVVTLRSIVGLLRSSILRLLGSSILGLLGCGELICTTVGAERLSVIELGAAIFTETHKDRSFQ